MKGQVSSSRYTLLENIPLGYRVYSLKFKSINQYQYIYIYIYNERPHMRIHKVLPCDALMLHLAFFYIFSLLFFYCYPIDYSNLFLLLYKFSIFQLFLLSFFYCYPIDDSNLFLLLYTTWTALDNQTKSYSLQNRLHF